QTANTLTTEGLTGSSAKMLPPGTVLLAMYGASIGRLGITGVPMATNQAIAAVVPNNNVVDTRFLFYYLRSQREALRRAGKGAAQPNISLTIVRSWPIPLPPIEEQRRIVAALEGHLSHIDAGSAGLAAVRRRLVRLKKQIIIEAVPIPSPEHWKMT